MSMYLYILSTYLYVLVSTKCPGKVEIKHTGFGLCQMRLGVLNEYMVVQNQNNAVWLPRTVRVVQPVHTSMYLYLVCTEYIPVCTWIAKIILSTLCFYFWQWEKILCVRDRYVVVFKNENSARLHGNHTCHNTCTYWVHTSMYWYVQFSITYRYVLCTDRYIQVCTKNHDFVQPVTIPDLLKSHFAPATCSETLEISTL